MFRSFISKLTTYLFVFFVTLLSCFPVFAWLAKDDHAPDNLANATMTYSSFPDDVPAGGISYKITAYVLRWDGSDYWESYKIWVHDD